MASIASLSSQTLDLPPSCIAFNQSNPDLLVVGTYYLHPQAEHQEPASSKGHSVGESSDETPSTASVRRTGTVLLCRLEADDTISTISRTQTPSAVLDLKWSPHDPSLLALATSTGQIALYRLDLSPNPSLNRIGTHTLAGPSTLILFLAFHPSIPDLLGLTLSTGAVALFPLPSPLAHHEGPPLGSSVTEVTTHSLEPWVLTFLPKPCPDPASGVISVLSGGDDGVLALARVPASDPDAPSPLGGFRDRRAHGAGVTALLPLPAPSTRGPGAGSESRLGAAEGGGGGGEGGGEEGEGAGGWLVVSGSYDDRIRLLRLPGPGGPARRPEVLAEEDLGGGVWRVEVLREDRGGEEGWLLLVSCMYAGARVVRLSWTGGEGGGWGFEVVGRFEEHASMNYASAAQPEKRGEGGREERRIVSTSFYDRLMCVWRF